jgi:hypothetical protein
VIIFVFNLAEILVVDSSISEGAMCKYETKKKKKIRHQIF